ncbi:MAG: hypothetical protein V4676_08480, partial [Bacteroidota bacterium]
VSAVYIANTSPIDLVQNHQENTTVIKLDGNYHEGDSIQLLNDGHTHHVEILLAKTNAPVMAGLQQ